MEAKIVKNPNKLHTLKMKAYFHYWYTFSQKCPLIDTLK